MYISHKWIVDPDPIEVQPDWHICTHENTWLRKVSWDPLQWTWHDPYGGKGSKPISCVATLQLPKPPESRLLQRSGTHIKFLTQLSPSFGRKSGNNNT